MMAAGSGSAGREAPECIFVGVDGGGTRSRALVADVRGRPLGSADGGPGLIDPVDPERAVRSVTRVVRAAAANAGVALPVRGLWAGLAGAGHRGAREAVEAALAGAGLAARIAVGTDVEAAHADAFGDGPGMLCVVGTGSMVRAVGPGGEVVQVGGWGHLLGDEGSGYRIGLEGLGAVMQATDGRGPDSSLGAVLLVAAGVTRPRELVGWAARATKGEIAALSVLVAAEAEAGDAVAAGIVERAVAAIRSHLVAALGRTEEWADRPVVALAGGLVGEGRPLREAVAGVAGGAGCRVHPREVVPERGAVGLGIRTGAA